MEWNCAADEAARGLIATGVAADLFCVETLDYPSDYISGVVSRHGLSVCLDTGHVVMRGDSVEADIARWGELIRVVHLHGIEDGRDHRDLSHVPDELKALITKTLSEGCAGRRVLTMEIFGQDELNRSLRAMEPYT